MLNFQPASQPQPLQLSANLWGALQAVALWYIRCAGWHRAWSQPGMSDAGHWGLIPARGGGTRPDLACRPAPHHSFGLRGQNFEHYWSKACLDSKKGSVTFNLHPCMISQNVSRHEVFSMNLAICWAWYSLYISWSMQEGIWWEVYSHIGP